METMTVCAVCGNKNAEAAIPSGLAPVSSPQCLSCQKVGAEPLEVVHTWIALNGGTEKCAEFARGIVSIYSGASINWQRIVELYNANEEEILTGVEDNFPHLGANITKDYLEGIDDKDDDIEYIDEKK